MLKQRASILRKIAIALDLIIVVGSFLAAYYLGKTFGALGPLIDYVWLLLFAIPCILTVLNVYKFYTSLRLSSYLSIVRDLIKIHVISGILLAAVIFILDPHHYSRILFICFLLTDFLLMTICKVSIKLLLIRLRREGFNSRNILIVGAGNNAVNLCELINEHDEWGLNITSLTIDTNYDNRASSGFHANTVVCSVEEIVDFCKVHTIDEIIFAMDKKNGYNIEQYIDELQALGLIVRVVIDFLSIPNSNKEVSLFFDEIPMLTYVNFSLNSNQILAKRCLDIVGALVGLFINLLILPFVVLAIKLDSPGPVFFGQLRVCENGRRFKCWKYRTMHVNAEAQKEKLMAQNEMKGAMFKIKNDPRVTRVGSFLRKSSLDEFPQFWNVLTGEMSLVGTRPPTPDEVAKYENWHRRRISIKPGITGLWQISGRNQVNDFDDVVRLDIRYIEEWSIWLDIEIILKTPVVMLTRSGAS